MASIGFLIGGALVIYLVILTICSVVYPKNQSLKNEKDMIKQLKIYKELK